jgi:hypothetical protein
MRQNRGLCPVKPARYVLVTGWKQDFSAVSIKTPEIASADTGEQGDNSPALPLLYMVGCRFDSYTAH